MRLAHSNILFFGTSDVGHVRSSNEDAWGALDEIPFYVLADGMGGHQAGEIAARQTVDYLLSSMKELILQPNKEWSKSQLLGMTKILIENANTLIYNLGKKHSHLKGMGTTLCTLLFYEKSLIFAHVGDSRIYRFHAGELSQLTHDHSRESQSDESGLAPLLRARGVLTRAIGPLKKVIPEVQALPLGSDEIFMMCSDGLTSHLSNAEIAAIMQENLNLTEMGQKLIERAKEKGGNDNITVVLAKVQDDDTNLSRS